MENPKPSSMIKPRKSHPNTQTLAANPENHTKKPKPWPQTLKIIQKKQNPKPYQIAPKNPNPKPYQIVTKNKKNGAKFMIFFENNDYLRYSGV